MALSRPGQDLHQLVTNDRPHSRRGAAGPEKVAISKKCISIGRSYSLELASRARAHCLSPIFSRLDDRFHPKPGSMQQGEQETKDRIQGSRRYRSASTLVARAPTL